MLRTAFKIIALAVATKAAKEVSDFIVKDKREIEARRARKLTEHLVREIEHISPGDLERIMDGPILTSGMTMPRPELE